MKLHLDKIHNVKIETWDTDGEIVFMLRQYEGIKFEIAVRDGKLNGCGLRRCFEWLDGIECKLSNRQYTFCKKYINENYEKLFEYFKDEWHETKLPLLLIVERK